VSIAFSDILTDSWLFLKVFKALKILAKQLKSNKFYLDLLIWCLTPIFSISEILKKFRRVAPKQKFGFLLSFYK
jgi:hypothetical protein